MILKEEVFQIFIKKKKILIFIKNAPNNSVKNKLKNKKSEIMKKKKRKYVYIY